ncbi:sigma-70 family RNA polymerase sigma factor [Candidatus Falkowbacteria bacterium]|nr:sigma-70 family RNA polymerase sigma factor [Candidatus Falkowbacteria bacterium]
MPKITDENLVARYLAGDKKSLEILIKKYLKPIFNFCYYYTSNEADAEDITQEVFVKIWKNLQKFDQAKSFSTWLFAITKNTALDFLKKKKNVPFSAYTEEEEKIFFDSLIDRSPLPDKLCEQAETKRNLDTKLGLLPLKYRKVINLRYRFDLSFSEISKRLNEPLNTVKSRYRRGVIMLKKIYQKT